MENWSRQLDFENIIKQWGSPYYLFNKSALKKNIELFSQFVGSPRHIYFPIKANPSRHVLNELKMSDTSFDCASPYEIQLILNLKVPHERIIYNSPVLDALLAADILKKGSQVVIDSEEIYNQLKQHLTPQAKGRLFLRIHPDINLDYQNKRNYQQNLAHASQFSKFGLNKKSIIDICKNSSHPISGLHIHAGSRMDNLDSFKILLNYLHNLVDEIALATGQEITHLNIGGGLGINFTPFDQFPSLDDYVKELTPLKKRYTYYVEPGNALAGNTMGLLTKVLYMKQHDQKKWALIDVGANQLINLIALRTPHQILDKNNRALPFEGNDSIGGPLCFAGDIVLPQTNLENIHTGDPLFIQHCGAYCYALSNDFNGQITPGLLAIDQDKIELVEERRAPFGLKRFSKPS